MINYTNIITIFLVFIFALISKDASAGIFDNDSGPKLFGTKESKSSRLSPFPKWMSMLDRYSPNANDTNAQCTITQSGRNCSAKDWYDVIEMLQDKDILTKLKYVNKYNNSIRYITDPRNWNLPDYWSTPYQFLARNGDCEDYAISKYMALKKLGVPISQMRIVVLMDNNLRIYHSVLAVYVGDEIYILDNQIQDVVRDTSIYHYDPVFSINEQYWWRHN